MSSSTTEFSPGASSHVSRTSRPDLSTIDNTAIEHLLQANSTLYSTGEGADVTIICKEEVLSAHKAIICRRSTYFMNECFRKNSGTGVITIDLQDQDTETVKRVHRFLYKLNYLQDQESQLPVHHTSPVLHAQMFATGVSFGIASLRQTAINNLTKWLEHHATPPTRPVTPLFTRDSFVSRSDVQPLGSNITTGRQLPNEELVKLTQVMRIIWATSADETQGIKNTLFEYVAANLDGLSPLSSFSALLNSGVGFASEWLQFRQPNT